MFDIGLSIQVYEVHTLVAVVVLLFCSNILKVINMKYCWFCCLGNILKSKHINSRLLILCHNEITYSRF